MCSRSWEDILENENCTIHVWTDFEEKVNRQASINIQKNSSK